MQNKKTISLLLFLILIATAVFLGLRYKSIFTKTPPPLQAPAVQNQPAQEAPEWAKELIKNTFTGTVQKIDAKTLTVQSGSDSKTYNLTKDTFVLRMKDKIENKKVSNIAVGMKVYVQFDPQANNAQTITLQE